MAVLHLQRLLLLLIVGLGAATAVPVVPAAAEAEGTRSAPADFGLHPSLLQQTGAALASQHSDLMADTDVFGLYRDHPGPSPGPPTDLPRDAAGPAASQAAAPASIINSNIPLLFPDPFAAFPGPVVPAVGSALDPVPEMRPLQWSGQGSDGGPEEVAEEADQPTEQASVHSAEPERPARQTAYATAPRTQSVTPQALSAAPEAPSAALEMLPRLERLSAGPEMSAGVEEQTARLPEAADAAGRVASTGREIPPASPTQPLTLPDTHILCLLPEHGRHRAAPATKHEHAARAPTPRAAESGHKPAAGAALPGAGGTEAGRTAALAPPLSETYLGSPADAGSADEEARPLPSQLHGPEDTDQQTPFLYQHQFDPAFGLPQQTAPAADRAAFDQLWSQFGADAGAAAADGQQALFGPAPDEAMFPSAGSDALPDASAFGLQPSAAGGTKPGPQEQLRSPTYFSSYPRPSQYPQRSSGYYPAASRSPAASNGWGQPAGGWQDDSPWPYAARSAPTQVSRRTAYPAPWAGQGRGPTGAVSWPWPALATESRGRPQLVPSSGLYLVQQSGRYPLYSQWYRPAVVPLPGGVGGGGGGGGGGGWWTPAGRFVRPATAMATSEESGGDSPPLSGDWRWPAVSMLGGRDALLVTGVGRSSGAMARAAGQHGWPPVARVSAGGSRHGGSYSRASSGGFDLIFQDGMFATGPMALRKSPDGYVPPLPKRPTSTAADTEDEPADSGDTETDAGDAETDAGDTETDAGDAETDAGDAETDAGDAETDADDGQTAEEEVEGSGADEE